MLADWKVEQVNVAIDAGTFTSEVYKYVVESGYRWKAMKGDDRPFFRVPSGQPGVSRNMMFQISMADPAIGTVMQGAGAADSAIHLEQAERARSTGAFPARAGRRLADPEGGQ
jgi:hypothetical protein